MRSRLALFTALVVLLVPASAAADQTFTVNSVGDGTKVAAGAVCETATPGECTVRAAIEAANADAETDVIAFGPLFDGGSGSAITLGSLLPEPNSPVRIDGGPCTVAGVEAPCVAIKGVDGFATLSVRANESTVEFIKFEGGSVGLRAFAQGGPGSGVKIFRNAFTGVNTAIESTGTIGGSGNLIERNTIEVPFTNGNQRGISLRNGPNLVLGNVITGSCCMNAISLDLNASGNQIGGDDADSENVINGFNNGAIAMFGAGASNNEVRRNRGENGGPFIGFYSGAFSPAAPALATVTQSSISGTADPGAVVRVFRKATEWEGEIAGFLGEANADINGNWKVSGFAAVPVGTFVTATQTLDGGTSPLAAAVTAQADPPAPPSGCPAVPSQCPPTPPPAPPADTTKPKVTIKKAPKAKSTATTAKFVFSANEAGSKFKCKLDKKAFANCGSPKTYKKLKPGKHVFKVKATDAAGNVSAVVTRSFSVLPPLA